MKRLYNVAGFTGIDDPYEPPSNCEVCTLPALNHTGPPYQATATEIIVMMVVQIEITQKDGICPTPNEMAGQVVSYLEDKGYLEAQ